MTEMPTHLSVTDTLADIRRYFESFENQNHMVRICSRGPTFEIEWGDSSTWKRWYTAGYDITTREGFLKWKVNGEYLVMPARDSLHQKALRIRMDNILSIELYQPRTTLWVREFTK